MPWFVFEIRQGCGCKESFQCRIDLADFPYDAVPRVAFDELKQQFRKARCAKCRPAPPRPPRAGRTTTRRNVRTDDTDDIDGVYPDGYDPARIDNAVDSSGLDPDGL
jgi:hypothetical protein